MSDLDAKIQAIQEEVQKISSLLQAFLCEEEDISSEEEASPEQRKRAEYMGSRHKVPKDDFYGLRKGH